MTIDDDFKRFKERVYSRVDENGNQVLGVKSTSPQMTISRLRRCQNCLHFDTEDKAISHYNHCIERDKRVLREQGCSDQGIREHVASLDRSLRANLGAVGICLIRDKRTDEGASGDFTAFSYQCDRWDGRIIVTPQEAASDPSAQEVLDNLKKVD